MQLSFPRAFGVFFLQLFSMIAVSVILRKLSDQEEHFAFSMAMFGAVVVCTAISILITVRFGIFYPHKFKLRELGWNLEHASKSIGLGLVGFSVCFAAVGIALTIVGEGSFRTILDNFRMQTTEQRLAYVLIGLHAGFLEESVFRGYMQTVFANRFGNVLAIIAVAILFSVYHLQFHPVPLVVKFAFGVIFGTTYFLSGNLFAPALAHLLIWIILGET